MNGCHRTLRLLVAALALIASASLTSAQEFRVASKVFQGDAEKPDGESLTLFHEGMIYDFLTTSSQEITIFDLPRGRIILLDPVNKIRTEVDTKSLGQFIDQMRTRGLQQNKSSLLKFCADPKFEEGKDKEGWMTFTSSHMTYRVKPLSGQSPTEAAAYRQFCDWGAKVNVVMHPGGLPPFPRMAINAALDRDDVLPEQVERTVPGQGLFGKSTVVRSEHVFSSGLLTEDLKKINEAGEQLVSLRPVSFNEYLQTAHAKPAEKK